MKIRHLRFLNDRMLNSKEEKQRQMEIERLERTKSVSFLSVLARKL